MRPSSYRYYNGYSYYPYIYSNPSTITTYSTPVVAAPPIVPINNNPNPSSTTSNPTTITSSTSPWVYVIGTLVVIGLITVIVRA